MAAKRQQRAGLLSSLPGCGRAEEAVKPAKGTSLHGGSKQQQQQQKKKNKEEKEKKKSEVCPPSAARWRYSARLTSAVLRLTP